jgi:hypothetical protein
VSDDMQDEIDRQDREGYPGQPARNKQVLQMNESTSDDWDKVPFPAKQQMGYHGDLTDARSGNGVDDRNQEGWDRGGHLVQPVTYHLEHTPPPAEPMGAPGSASYNEHARGTEGLAGTGGGFGAQRHADSGPISTQTEVPGRDARIMSAKDQSGSAPAETPAVAQSSSDGSKPAAVQNDATGDDEPVDEAADVPNASVQDVLTWVGDDKGRAKAALDAENARPTPRATLVSQLNEKL